MADDEEGLYKFCDENGIPRAVLETSTIREFVRALLGVRGVGVAEAARLPDWCHPAFAFTGPSRVAYGDFVEAEVVWFRRERETDQYSVRTRLGSRGGNWGEWSRDGVFTAAGVRDLLERLVVATVGGRK